jgi:hypothetical protein
MGEKYLDCSGIMYHSIFSFLKRISLKGTVHEMDLDFDDMYG